MPVAEAVNGEPVLSGRVYIAPGGEHLTLSSHNGAVHFTCNDAPPIWGVRPAADPLFATVAELFGARSVGVVLTGMGRDGAEGLRLIRAAGGLAIVQSPQTAVVAGMPSAAIEHAGFDECAPVEQIASAIARASVKVQELVDA
jgi:two-component system chemotaxis response regulator CheB